MVNTAEHAVTEVTDLAAYDVLYCVKSTDFEEWILSQSHSRYQETFACYFFLHPTILPILLSMHQGIRASSQVKGFDFLGNTSE